MSENQSTNWLNNPGLIANVFNKEDKKEYHIPKYQRGYRWTEIEVEKLLEDIFESVLPLSEKDIDYINSQNTTPLDILNRDGVHLTELRREDIAPYCIQPLAVSYDKANKRYNVIDGQQRLTTLAIILAAIKEVESHDKSRLGLEEVNVDISYDSRAGSADYLNNLFNINGNGLAQAQKDKDKYIDYAHMYNAFETAKKFFTAHLEKLNKLKGDLLYCLQNVVLKRTRFIWYEPKIDKNNDEQTEFSNFNSGKIELTNAELIKAEFMNPDNLTRNDGKDDQIVMSEMWDEMENQLHDDELWAFIPHEDQYTNTDSVRIEHLFRLFAIKKSLKPRPSSFGLHEAVANWINEQLNPDKNKQLNDKKNLTDCWQEFSGVFYELLDLYRSSKEYGSTIYNLSGLYVYLCRESRYIDRIMKDRTNKTPRYEIAYNGLEVGGNDKLFGLTDVFNTPRDQRRQKLCDMILELFFRDYGETLNKTDPFIILRSLDKSSKEAKEAALEYAVKCISYSSSSTMIVPLMLIYNVALLCITKANNSRYSFDKHNKATWEREHIFASNTDKNSTTHSELVFSEEYDEQSMRNALKILQGKDYSDYVDELYTYKLEDFLTDKDFLAKKGKELNDLLTKLGFNNLEEAMSSRKDERKEKDKKATDVQDIASILNGYYKLIDEAERILAEQDQGFKVLLTKRFMKKHGMEKLPNGYVIGIFNDEDYEGAIGELMQGQQNGVTFQKLKDKYGWKYAPTLPKDPDDAERERKLKENFTASFLDYWKDNLIAKLKNGTFPDTEIDYLYALMSLEQKGWHKAIDSFFEHSPKNAADNEFASLLKDDHISNMCLLAGGDNSSIKNVPYYKKRELIHKSFTENMGEDKGGFVPYGSLLVFSGAYANESVADNFWLPASRLAYLNNIIKVLNDLFFPEKQQGGNNK